MSQKSVLRSATLLISDDLKHRIAEAAETSCRSFSREIVYRLLKSFEDEPRQKSREVAQ